MQTQPSFEKLVRIWFREELGMRMVTGESGIHALTILVGNIHKYLGLTEEEIRKKQDLIWNIIVNKRLDNSKRKEWKDYYSDLLEYAFIDFFPSEFKISRDVITPEVQERIAVRKVKKVLNNQKDDNKPENSSNESEVGSSVVDKYPEITEDMRNGIEGPEVVYDPDWAKNLGLEDE